MLKFEFDPIEHIYKLIHENGRIEIIPSVTQCLPYEFFDDKPNRMDLGSAIHRMAYLNNIGKSDNEILNDPDLVEWFQERNFWQYLRANKKFRADHKLNGVYDYKRSPYPATELQLAGYQLLAKEGLDLNGEKPEYTDLKYYYETSLYHPIYKFAGTMDILAGDTACYAVYLKDNGNYSLVNHSKNLRKNVQIFLSYLTVYRHRKEKKI